MQFDLVNLVRSRMFSSLALDHSCLLQLVFDYENGIIFLNFFNLVTDYRITVHRLVKQDYEITYLI